MNVTLCDWLDCEYAATELMGVNGDWCYRHSFLFGDGRTTSALGDVQ